MLTKNQNELIERFQEHGQGHIFKYFDSLTFSQKDALIKQAECIDLVELSQLIKKYHDCKDIYSPLSESSLQPVSPMHLPRNGVELIQWKNAQSLGEKALALGKVAVFTVAGGQGTRLGFNGPKGTFPVTPIKKKSLFQVFAEKIKAAQRRYGCKIPWFIMTSESNHGATILFFEKNNYFGLEEVYFLQQGMMPIVDIKGKIILKDTFKIAMRPDGHGGALKALLANGSFQLMQAMGIEIISYFQVDNPLTNILDPFFIGFHVEQKSEFSSKMVKKIKPDERVGLLCVQNGKTKVVEYTMLPESIARLKDHNGALKFNAASIAVHLIDLNFAVSVATKVQLPANAVVQKSQYVDEFGNICYPEKSNAIHFEKYIFDALDFAQNPTIIETRRSTEFSPIKNDKGADSPETCLQDQCRLYNEWLRNAGATSEETNFNIEVSPLFASTEEEFIKKWHNLDYKPVVKNNLYLE